jgi:hypothetical protein
VVDPLKVIRREEKFAASFVLSACSV